MCSHTLKVMVLDQWSGLMTPPVSLGHLEDVHYTILENSPKKICALIG